MSRVREAALRSGLGEALGISTEPAATNDRVDCIDVNDGPAGGSRPLAPVETEGRHASQMERIMVGQGALYRAELVSLVQHVCLLRNSHSPRIVVFAGIEDGTASAEICANSALVLAGSSSGEVCLVDANLRRPTLHNLFGVPKSPGLAEAAYDPDAMAHKHDKTYFVRLDHTDVWLMPAGAPAGRRPPEFASDRVCACLAALKNSFRYVFVNSPPATQYSDAILLGQHADGLILIIDANSTKKDVARATKKRLETANVNLLGAVLNTAHSPRGTH